MSGPLSPAGGRTWPPSFRWTTSPSWSAWPWRRWTDWTLGTPARLWRRRRSRGLFLSGTLCGNWGTESWRIAWKSLPPNGNSASSILTSESKRTATFFAWKRVRVPRIGYHERKSVAHSIELPATANKQKFYGELALQLTGLLAGERDPI